MDHPTAALLLATHQGVTNATGLIPQPLQQQPSASTPVALATLTLIYTVGIVGNVAALFILRKESKRAPKVVLMLTYLAFNDLVALLGMAVLMYLQMFLSQDLARQQWLCILRVIWRSFGLGSGSVSLVMAVDRWLALNHPFISQRRVTPTRIRRTILCLWALVILLSCLPFTGFGLYYDPSREPAERCVRYRFATKTTDVVYAYLFFGVGVSMCLVIVACNLGVIHVMCCLSKKNIARQESNLNNAALQYKASSANNTVFKRESTCSRSSEKCTRPSITKEEIAFAKVLGILCIGFVACWLPQMASIIIAQMNPSVQRRPFFFLADVLMMLNFTLDPFVYVVNRRYNRMKLRNAPRPGISRPGEHRESNCVSNTGNSNRLGMNNIAGSSSRFPQQSSRSLTKETRMMDQQHRHCACVADLSSSERGLVFEAGVAASASGSDQQKTTDPSIDTDPSEKEYVPLQLLLPEYEAKYGDVNSKKSYLRRYWRRTAQSLFELGSPVSGSRTTTGSRPVKSSLKKGKQAKSRENKKKFKQVVFFSETRASFSGASSFYNLNHSANF